MRVVLFCVRARIHTHTKYVLEKFQITENHIVSEMNAIEIGLFGKSFCVCVCIYLIALFADDSRIVSIILFGCLLNQTFSLVFKDMRLVNVTASINHDIHLSWHLHRLSVKFHPTR